MVRTFLGNIQGPKGDPGDASNINEYGIGINNLFNMSDMYNYDSSGRQTFDTETGVINYENTAYYLRVDKTLDPGTYTMKVKDYIVAENHYSDRLFVNIRRKSDSEIVFGEPLNREEPYSVTIDTKDVYQIELRPTGSARTTGMVEKFMFVAGDVVSNWQPSIKDISRIDTYKYMEARVLSTAIEYGGLHQLGLYGTEGDDLTSGRAIVLTDGLWHLNWVYTFKDVVDEVVIYVFLNGSQIIRSTHNESGTFNLSTNINADDDDVITFSVRTASETSTMTFGQNVGENRLTVAKQ